MGSLRDSRFRGGRSRNNSGRSPREGGWQGRVERPFRFRELTKRNSFNAGSTAVQDWRCQQRGRPEPPSAPPDLERFPEPRSRNIFGQEIWSARPALPGRPSAIAPGSGSAKPQRLRLVLAWAPPMDLKHDALASALDDLKLRCVPLLERASHGEWRRSFPLEDISMHVVISSDCLIDAAVPMWRHRLTRGEVLVVNRGVEGELRSTSGDHRPPEVLSMRVQLDAQHGHPLVDSLPPVIRANPTGVPRSFGPAMDTLLGGALRPGGWPRMRSSVACARCCSSRRSGCISVTSPGTTRAGSARSPILCSGSTCTSRPIPWPASRSSRALPIGRPGASARGSSSSPVRDPLSSSGRRESGGRQRCCGRESRTSRRSPRSPATEAGRRWHERSGGGSASRRRSTGDRSCPVPFPGHVESQRASPRRLRSFILRAERPCPAGVTAATG